jgi:AraC-like DNA-binding protein
MLHRIISRELEDTPSIPAPMTPIAGWSAELGLGRRNFTRGVRRETGMSFAEWRRQACLLIALPRLAAGEAVTSIAMGLGYDSPPLRLRPCSNVG